MRTIKLCASAQHHQQHHHVTLREAIQRAERRIQPRSGRPAGGTAAVTPRSGPVGAGHGTTGPLH